MHKIESGVSIMCNLSEGVFEKGYREGYKQGLMMTLIKNLMKSTELTENQAMDALMIPKDEQPKYSKLLKDEYET